MLLSGLLARAPGNTNAPSRGRESRMARTRRIVVIGAGPGGLCMGAKLRDAGFDDFVILEQTDGVGGTWRHNSYPGAAYDIPSHLYSFSFERKYDWSRAYATQPEILDYFEQFATKYGLEPHLRLGSGARRVVWSNADARWTLSTDADTYEADVVVSAVGMFNEVNWPDIPGLDTFGGTLFHSARWDHDHDLRGESVAVIGSGASAIQFVPAIAPAVSRLYHFQRQPQWVAPKLDPPFSEEDIARCCADPSAGTSLALPMTSCRLSLKGGGEGVAGISTVTWAPSGSFTGSSKIMAPFLIRAL